MNKLIRSSLLVFTISSFSISTQAQTITTIAGHFGTTYIGDGGPASAAKLSAPQSMVKDAAGNLYIADAGNFRIRKISTSGNITTVAGNGTPGFSGDGGAATAASMLGIGGICLDAAGNIYVADGTNNRIRKVSTSGIITTVAGNGSAGYGGDGGPATAAILKNPSDVVIDASGKLYIADKGNHVIRMVTTGGIISTIAGDSLPGDGGDGGAATLAEMNNPTGVAVDAAGNVYVADQLNGRVRKIDVAGIITSICGIGTLGYNGDGILATGASLYQPTDVHTDGAGNVYIADNVNNRIRKINVAGIISTVAGTGMAAFTGDGSLATAAQLDHPAGVYVDGAGNIYIADALNNRVRQVNTTGIINTISGISRYIGDGGPATNAELITVGGIVVDKHGNVYFSETNGHRVRKITPDGTISTYAGTGVEGTTGDGGMATDAAINRPEALVLDTSGNLYFTEFGSRVRKVSPSGIISTTAGVGSLGNSGDGGAATDAYISTQGLAADTAGNMYLSCNGYAIIRQIDNTGTITTIAGTGVIAYGGDGGPATGADFNYPYGMSIDTAGNLYIADAGNNAIRMITAAGDIFTVAGNGTSAFSGDGGPATAAELNFAPDVAVMGDKLIIADEGNARLRMITPDGTISTIAGTGTLGYSGDGGTATAAELWLPRNVAIGPDGNSIYISDFGVGLIRKISNVIPTTPPTNINEPFKEGKTALFPNPVTTEVRLYAANVIKDVMITNVVGQRLTEKKYNSKNIAVDVADLVPGIYFIRINNRETLKFIKQ